jgi:hypothetical protein
VTGFNQKTNDVNQEIVFQSALQVVDPMSRQSIAQEFIHVYVDMFKETGKALKTGEPYRASASTGSTSSSRQAFLPLNEEEISIVIDGGCLPGG